MTVLRWVTFAIMLVLEFAALMSGLWLSLIACMFFCFALIIPPKQLEPMLPVKYMTFYTAGLIVVVFTSFLNVALVS